MSRLSPGALARMHSTHEDVMHDTCEVLTSTEVQNAYGEVLLTWAVQSTEVCGFNPLSRLQSGGGETVREAATFLETEARLRLPATVAVTPANRIRLTHRYGVALATPITYEIAGAVKTGPAATLLNLRRLDL